MPRPVLVRCQIDETGSWNFVCPGACWRSVCGGEEDARGMEKEYPYYRYGGMWKNKHTDGPASAKKPKKVKEKQKERRAKRKEALAKSSEQSDEDGGRSEETTGEGLET
ncbi:hypothetical protein DOTSEDRAFT_48665 [Dothistroma septosporum NZE10]|uniref:Uncharacterized protein n=1 Tax=Dothistroma septosporum (strain NZE10 / CBS 128990) TaxID=675120 RepID=N1PE42_DOTSN|nr:hypothetical protein DOTSEDRAFT_48665 [Dothistroma septosporum NZE10]